jgi:hypothetical protein
MFARAALLLTPTTLGAFIFQAYKVLSEPAVVRWLIELQTYHSKCACRVMHVSAAFKTLPM